MIGRQIAIIPMPICLAVRMRRKPQSSAVDVSSSWKVGGELEHTICVIWAANIDYVSYHAVIGVNNCPAGIISDAAQ